MIISVSTDQSVTCIKPEGRLDTVTSAEFDQAVQPLAEQDTCLIIDFSACNYMSSTGIRVLVGLEKKLKAKGGGLSIAGMSADVFQVLEMAGLNQTFRFFDTCQSAREEILRLQQIDCPCQEWDAGEHRFLYQPFEKSDEAFLIWKNAGMTGYNELGFAIGTGLAAESPEEEPGLFITTGNSAGFLPTDITQPTDFRYTFNPAQAAILVKEALSFGLIPDGQLRLEKSTAVTLLQLIETIYKNSRNQFTAFVTASFPDSAPTITCCVILDESLKNRLKAEGFDAFPGIVELQDKAFSVWGARFEVSELTAATDVRALPFFLKEKLALDNMINVSHVQSFDVLYNPQTWIFTTNKLEDANIHRIAIDAPEAFFAEPYKSYLTRRLYNDAVRVELKTLHGGYSAQTFQVASYDKEGRRLRPTVLKLANRAMITREADRCKNNALPYIFNNSAKVLGTEFFNDYGALCYNFVGIGGGQTQLKWLTKYFEDWSVEKLNPLFDKIFTQILEPWYGQPVARSIYLFKDHDPTLTFFTNLWDTAARELSISPDEPYLTVEETSQRLVNPYWFLKHEYPKRREMAFPYYTSICHGDLNMQNILLDQDMNVYLIDFSETKSRSVISDFARLEAIFMIEHAPIKNPEEMLEMIWFVNGFYGIESLNQLPDNTYQGPHKAIMDRNVALTWKMREYAMGCTNGETTLIPYYMAMLEWVLPIVCYYSATPEHKRLSMIVAGLLCEKVMAS